MPVLPAPTKSVIKRKLNISGSLRMHAVFGDPFSATNRSKFLFLKKTRTIEDESGDEI